ncbi:bifunctional adenosylcobinamide kinase/adenosylcobinamide-phosphate guanylyltransferase [Actinokineospora sp. NBRC 105648]|uniref:bifunctional adenosylcobinamide kinase/adenosylcobinamide-phosphate guanylyltransferase n=1 Tax=Actinokineospora sp. NBRC 105648 TaxID=3032206 RepID=UPI0024A36FD2|nr:bifunctional adenosylcobinamide kinase/adenosylcobinamide-phosphate guanylyltransferase [Actinokineospora sp. NBRC 105648]GLZ42667.1 adenosylcobinamide kinase/adenosylcobinamide phosphate guanyltransferase [Actinokineospora sp. NBRC 105648]
MDKTLVLGGARSGKSAHAEGLLSGPSVYLATARRVPGDTEWDARIATHIARRPKTWLTVEAPDTDTVVAALAAPELPVLLDDVATWLTGVLDDAGAWESADLDRPRAEAMRLVAAVRACPAPVVLVSAEVGLGVVPGTRSGRLFRDELGAVNASLAEVCSDVLLLVAGLPLRLK